MFANNKARFPKTVSGCAHLVRVIAWMTLNVYNLTPSMRSPFRVQSTVTVVIIGVRRV